jgi:hypothetical protein
MGHEGVAAKNVNVDRARAHLTQEASRQSRLDDPSLYLLNSIGARFGSRADDFSERRPSEVKSRAVLSGGSARASRHSHAALV